MPHHTRHLSLAPLLAALFLLPSAAEPAAAQTVELRHHFTKGSVLRYEVTTVGRSEIPGGMGSMEQTQRQVMVQEVLSVDPSGNARIRTGTEAISMEMASPMGALRFDSNDEPGTDNPLLAPLRAMLGVEIDIIIAPDGSLVELRGTDTLRERMPAAATPQARAILDEMLSDAALRNSIELAYQTLPGRPVTPGESWESGTSLPLPFGILSIDYLQTLDEVELRNGQRVALISIVGTLGAMESDPSSPMAGMIQFDGGEVSGTLEFDVDAGHLLIMRQEARIRVSGMGNALTSVSENTMRLLP